MSAAAKRTHKLDLFRLDETTISAGCFACPLLKQCGGYTRAGGGWSCMDRCASCDSKCTLVCLKKPAHFARALLEIGGFQHRGTPPLIRPAAELPPYVPVLQHGVETEVPLAWVALPLRAVMRFERGRYQPLASSPNELRAELGLPSSTNIILLGTGKDRPIESYWRWRRHHGVPHALAKLGLTCGIAPNYSLFLEDPRTQHMFNRKRSLICASEWSGAGIGAIPYLQTVAPADWTYWEEFLLDHPEVRHVGKEFQTGLSRPERGQQAIDGLTRLQDRVGRPLHLVAIGAARYRDLIAKRFDSWTLLDSEPFMKAVKRRAATSTGRRIRWQRALGEGVADLLLHNVGRYEDWIAKGHLRSAP